MNLRLIRFAGAPKLEQNIRIIEAVGGPCTRDSIYGVDATSMALPRGHAASTNASPYFTFFTRVISWYGSRPVSDHKRKVSKIAGSDTTLNNSIISFNAPNPSTSNVNWYTRSMHR